VRPTTAGVGVSRALELYQASTHLACRGEESWRGRQLARHDDAGPPRLSRQHSLRLSCSTAGPAVPCCRRARYGGHTRAALAHLSPLPRPPPLPRDLLREPASSVRASKARAQSLLLLYDALAARRRLGAAMRRRSRRPAWTTGTAPRLALSARSAERELFRALYTSATRVPRGCLGGPGSARAQLACASGALPWSSLELIFAAPRVWCALVAARSTAD